MSFVDQAVTEIRRAAHKVSDPDPDYASIALAAQIYATAVYLFRHYKHPEMDLSARELLSSFGEAVGVARELEATSVLSLYEQLRQVLFTLATSYEPSVDRVALPLQTELCPVRDPDRKQTAIEGEVIHWLRPRSKWRELRVRRDAGDGHRLNEQPPNLAQDLVPLAMHWNREPPDVGRVDPDDEVLYSLIDVGHVRLGSLKVALCPLVDGSTPQFLIDDRGQFFFADRQRPISDPDQLRRHLVIVLEEAAQHEVDIVVLPELCIDPAARRVLLQELEAQGRAGHGLLALIAGSFHIWPEQQAPKPVNQAVALGPGGTSTWHHVKHGTFTMSHRQVLDARGKFFPVNLPDERVADKVTEYIDNGREILVCDSRLGRLAMVICADVVQPGSMAEAIKTWIRPDFLFILSMSPNTQVFLAEAEAMLRCHVSTFYVNARCTCKHPARNPDEPLIEPPDLAFALLAVREHPELPPTRIGLYSGEARPRYYDLKHKDWRTMPNNRGASLLPSGGLVVDVGAHFAEPPDL